MGAGKCASQAGHAFLGAFFVAQAQRAPAAHAYFSDPPGTKVTLQASSQELFQIKQLAEANGLPTFLVIDSGCPNFFGGEPIPTALGIGPATKDELPKKMRRLKLL